MSVSIEEFMKRLDNASMEDAIPYARVRLVSEAEMVHSDAVLQFKGYRALSDAYRCFFLETVEFVNVSSQMKKGRPLSEHYAAFVPRLCNDFLSLCGAERVAIFGYPYNGYTLLRNVFDNLILTSAAVQGVSNFCSIEGIEPGKPFDPLVAKKVRKNEEYNVRRKMSGDLSGLSDPTRIELARWDDLFDWETHGARLSLTKAIEWMKGQGPLPVLPQFEESAFAMYMNRFCEVSWMFHRLTPLLQTPGVLLSDMWVEKWNVIDQSFKQIVESLTKQLGKGIGVAIAELVRTKFPFTGRSVFPL
jgi:hypothetical protein